MGYDITLITPDGDPDGGTFKGELFLAGQPVTESWASFDGSPYHCGLCERPINLKSGPDDEDVTGDLTDGDHLGIVAIWWSPMAGVPEMCGELDHLRCVMDTSTMGSLGFFTGAVEFPSTGRHVA